MRVAVNATAVRSLNHGIGVYVASLLSRLVAEEPENHYDVFASPAAIEQLSAQNYAQDRVAFCPTTAFRPLRLLWETFALAENPLVTKADVLWGCHNSLPANKTCPQIVTIHDLGVFSVPQFYPRVKIPYFRWAIARAAKQADQIIADSEFVARQIETVLGVVPDRIKVIHCGIGHQFRPADEPCARAEIRQKYGLPDSYLFSLGVPEPKKNFERLITACVELKRRRPCVPLLVIGGGRSFGWRNRRVFSLAERHRAVVRLTDFIAPADLPAVYRMARIFIFPSLYEGFGIPPVEAMACGTPVICSNRASLPEVVGDAALTIDPCDTDGIASAIERLLDDQHLANELRTRGFNNARRFDWRNSARSLLAVFAEAIR